MRSARPSTHNQPACAGVCDLVACARDDAVVVHLRCAAADACRLRACGVYEGAHIRVVDGRHGVVLDARGTRLALGRSLARAISVKPQAER